MLLDCTGQLKKGIKRGGGWNPTTELERVRELLSTTADIDRLKKTKETWQLEMIDPAHNHSKAIDLFSFKNHRARSSFRRRTTLARKNFSAHNISPVHQEVVTLSQQKRFLILPISILIYRCGAAYQSPRDPQSKISWPNSFVALLSRNVRASQLPPTFSAITRRPRVMVPKKMPFCRFGERSPRAQGKIKLPVARGSGHTN